jgi:hypothetical protein
MHEVESGRVSRGPVVATVLAFAPETVLPIDRIRACGGDPAAP